MPTHRPSLRRSAPLWVRSTAAIGLALVLGLTWAARDVRFHDWIHRHEGAGMATPAGLAPAVVRALTQGCASGGCAHHHPTPRSDSDSGCDGACAVVLFSDHAAPPTTRAAAPAVRQGPVATPVPARELMRLPRRAARPPSCGPPDVA